MKVGVINVGDEILAGDTVNTNSSWLASRLSERGVEVEEILVIPDILEVISSRVGEFSDKYDAVIVTGGLGPTHDDITMEGVADAFGRLMEVNEDVYEMIKNKYASKSESLARRTAEIPEGSQPLINEKGVAPGCVIENVYVLPGVPEEMKEMFGDIENDFQGEKKHVGVLYTSTPESKMRQILEDAQEKFGVTVGSYPSYEDDNKIKITSHDSKRVKEARKWLEERLEKP